MSSATWTERFRQWDHERPAREAARRPAMPVFQPHMYGVLPRTVVSTLSCSSLNKVYYYYCYFVYVFETQYQCPSILCPVEKLMLMHLWASTRESLSSVLKNNKDADQPVFRLQMSSYVKSTPLRSMTTNQKLNI